MEWAPEIGHPVLYMSSDGSWKEGKTRTTITQNYGLKMIWLEGKPDSVLMENVKLINKEKKMSRGRPKKQVENSMTISPVTANVVNLAKDSQLTTKIPAKLTKKSVVVHNNGTEKFNIVKFLRKDQNDKCVIRNIVENPELIVELIVNKSELTVI